MAGAPAYANDLFGWAIAAATSLIGYDVELQLVPGPSAGMRGHAARTIENPFITESPSNWQEIRSVLVWTEANQVSSAALWTLNAMAHAG